MNKQYLYLIVLMFLLGAGLVLLPEVRVSREQGPLEVNALLNGPSRYVTTDAVAARIIRNDPDLLLIDVRKPEEYNVFSLEGAINIPVERMLDKEYASVLEQPGMDKVFFSNGDLTAERAWMLCTRLGIGRVYIMQGGLNRWAETILRPLSPPETAPAEDWARYDFRRAASLHFTGAAAAAPEEKPAVKKVKPKASPAQGPSGEGC